ncbi:ribokinase [Eupeodes corollae]|uniref:ribokinase n=1 Tax=Eupeodes corollae TaxID=290404 RepID=UPI002493B51A|nr:ribokinase [Eupeodes corollae]
MEVLVFGSAIVDFICYVPRLPKAGETLHGTSFATGFGGKGANQCVAAAKLGAKTAIIAKVGGDAWGKTYLDHLQKENVNTDHVQICSDETTGIAQICVAEGGENNIVIVAGANELLSENDVNKALDLFTESKVLICQLESSIEATIVALREFKGISILNGAPALENTPSELLEYSKIFCVNETEAALMTGFPINSLGDSRAALLRMIEMGANTVIITLGKHGAVYMKKTNTQEIVHIPAQKIEKVIDTTGAGDSFIGALAFYLARFPDFPLHQQIGGACAVASFSVQFPGTQSSFPDAQKVHTDLTNVQYPWKIL